MGRYNRPCREVLAGRPLRACAADYRAPGHPELRRDGRRDGVRRVSHESKCSVFSLQAQRSASSNRLQRENKRPTRTPAQNGAPQAVIHQVTLLICFKVHQEHTLPKLPFCCHRGIGAPPSRRWRRPGVRLRTLARTRRSVCTPRWCARFRRPRVRCSWV